jgi:hypothetical protein
MTTSSQYGNPERAKGTDLLSVRGSERSNMRPEKSNSVVSELILISNRSESVTLKKKLYVLKFTLHLK